MTNPAALARHARRALAEARRATLLVHGLDGDDIAVALHERDGRPRLICDTGSSVSIAARAARPAVLSVAHSLDATVVFTGTLVIDEVQDIDGTQVDIVGLRLSSVLLEREGIDGPLQQYELPLDIYFADAADVVAQYAARVLAHTNDVHRQHVRQFVARHCGASDNSIADARVASLDSAGVQIHWVDETGGHTMYCAFARPAGTSDQLALALREQFSP